MRIARNFAELSNHYVRNFLVKSLKAQGYSNREIVECDFFTELGGYIFEATPFENEALFSSVITEAIYEVNEAFYLLTTVTHDGGGHMYVINRNYLDKI